MFFASPLSVVRSLFFLFGITFACWTTQLPTISRFYQLDNSGIAWLLFGLTLGAIVGMTQTTSCLQKWGVVKTVRFLWLLMWLCMPLAFVWSNIIFLAVLIALIGAASGIVDVAINAEATNIEKELQRPILSSAHGMFSLGGLLGAALSSLLLYVQLPSLWILLLVIGVTSFTVWRVSYVLLPIKITAETMATSVQMDASINLEARKFKLPHGIIAWLALAATISMTIEGSVYDWSTLLMVEAFDSTPSFAAWSYGVFSAAMAIGRFGGDALRARISPSMLITFSAFAIVPFLTIALLFGNAWYMLLVFGLMGLAIANWVPVFYAVAIQCKEPNQSDSAVITSVASVAYVGFLAGPMVFGHIAHLIGIRYTYGLIVLLSLVMGIISYYILRMQAHTPPRTV